MCATIAWLVSDILLKRNFFVQFILIMFPSPSAQISVTSLPTQLFPVSLKENKNKKQSTKHKKIKIKINKQKINKIEKAQSRMTQKN